MKSIIAMCLLIMFSLASCSSRDELPFAPSEVNHRIGFVDKRYELTALVFRLAGSVDFNDAETPFQRDLNNTFSNFRNHPAVNFARDLGFAQDAVFRFAVHIEMTSDGFALVENTNFLLRQDGGAIRWTQNNANVFLTLLYDFYIDTNFAEFFNENIDFFTETSERFYMEVYRNINKEWFAPHGLNPENMRTVISPSASRMGYAAWVEGETMYESMVYAKLPYLEDFNGLHRLIVHEYAHALGNPIADVWYAENDEFRRWATTSVDPARNPGHARSDIMAGEYVTRAFEILYFVENHNANLAIELLNEIQFTFPYMEEVFAMVTHTEIINLRENVMELVLEVPFEIDDAIHTLDTDDIFVRWRIVKLHGELQIEQFALTLFASVDLTSQAGEVIVIDMNGEPYMWIDIGSGEGIGGRDASFRKYSVFPLLLTLEFFF